MPFLIRQLESHCRFLRQVALRYIARHALLWDKDVHTVVAKLAKRDLVGDVRAEASRIMRDCQIARSVKTVEVQEDALAEEEARLRELLITVGGMVDPEDGMSSQWSSFYSDLASGERERFAELEESIVTGEDTSTPFTFPSNSM